MDGTSSTNQRDLLRQSCALENQRLLHWYLSLVKWFAQVPKVKKKVGKLQRTTQSNSEESAIQMLKSVTLRFRTLSVLMMLASKLNSSLWMCKHLISSILQIVRRKYRVATILRCSLAWFSGCNTPKSCYWSLQVANSYWLEPSSAKTSTMPTIKLNLCSNSTRKRESNEALPMN